MNRDSPLVASISTLMIHASGAPCNYLKSFDDGIAWLASAWPRYATFVENHFITTVTGNFVLGVGLRVP